MYKCFTKAKGYIVEVRRLSLHVINAGSGSRVFRRVSVRVESMGSAVLHSFRVSGLPREVSLGSMEKQC